MKSLNKILILQKRKIFVFLFLFVLSNLSLSSADNQFQITTLDNPAPGYLHFTYPKIDKFFLVDNSGQIIIHKNSYSSGSYCFLLTNGNWIQSDSNSRYIVYDKNINVIDSIPNPLLDFQQSYMLDWHSVIVLSNGHYLLLFTKTEIRDLSQIVDGGNTEATVLSNVIVETDKTGTIYWKWEALDHLDILDVTEKIDLTMNTVDLTHVNSLYEDTDGNILVSIRHFDEIIKINKTTDSIIWRLGGSKSKKNQFTFIDDNQDGFYGFSHQHSINLLPNGNILIFDNGNLKSPQYSRAVEYAINENSKTATKVWEYSPNPIIYQGIMGSVQRLSNGNTLINWGKKKITEVRPDKTVAFELDFNDTTLIATYNAIRVVSQMDAVTKTINSTGTYNYNDTAYKTGITIEVNSVDGSAISNVEKHYYKPYNAIFKDSAFSQIYPYRWVWSAANISSISGTLKIKLDSLNISNPEKTSVFMRPKEGEGTFYELSNSYNPNTNEISANISSFGEFILVDSELETPILSKPLNNSKSKTNVKLEWSKLIGVSNYQVQISTSNLFLKPEVSFQTADNFFNFDSLEASTKYYWRVRGFNQKDTSDWSSVYNFTTEIGIPKLLSPINNFVGYKTKNSIEWGSVFGATYYDFQISENNNFIPLINENLNLTSTSIQVDNLDFNSLYYWRVRAHKESDTSGWSEVWQFLTTLPKTILLSPKNESINLQTIGELKWLKNNGAKNYIIELSEYPDFSIIIQKSSDLKTPSFSYSDLKHNSNYYWRVRAYRNTDTSDWSEVWSFRTLLESPTLLFPINQANLLNDLSIFFNWKANGKYDLFKLQISTDITFNKLLVDTTLTDDRIELAQFEDNTHYFWRVKSLLNEYYSNWSIIRGFALSQPFLSLISPNGSEVLRKDSTILISWQTNLNDAIKILLKQNDEEIFVITDSILSSEQSYEWTISNSIPDGENYKLSIQKSKDGIELARSQDIFTITSSTSVKDAIDGFATSYYPNPTDEHFVINLELSKSNFTNIRMLDILGNEVLEILNEYLTNGKYRYKINTSQLANGVYLLQMTNSEKIHTEKLIINH